MSKIGQGIQISVSWIPQKHGEYPSNAISVDKDVFVVRCKHEDEYIPGKLIPENKKCYCPYNGRELSFSKYEVLCDTSIDHYSKGYEWVKSTGDEYPVDAVVAGLTKDGKPVFIARGSVQEDMCSGKAVEGHKCAYMSWGGTEYTVDDYEILVWKLNCTK
uniref:DUF3421 domain-containing protein n=1 Tax=Trichobilharzia regenti TaxID=157069 RepID=A0AA85JP29_TRIRE|nr:unnamed protein product [Trichobilharzia regenti]